MLRCGSDDNVVSTRNPFSFFFLSFSLIFLPSVQIGGAGVGCGLLTVWPACVCVLFGGRVFVIYYDYDSSDWISALFGRCYLLFILPEEKRDKKRKTRV